MAAIISKMLFKSKEKKIRIAVDATPLQGKPSGIPLYISTLLAELVKKKDVQFYLYFSCKNPRWEFLFLPNVKARALHPLHRKQSFWINWIVPFFLWFDQIDLFWGTHQSVQHSLLQRKCKTCLTIYDLAFELFPSTLNPNDLTRLRQLFFPSVQKADIIAPISQGTLTKLSPYLASRNHTPKVVIIPPPIRDRFRKAPQASHVKETLQRYGLEGGFYLSVGTLEPRKNLCHLLKSYLSLLRVSPLATIPSLAIVGRFGWEGSHLQTSIDSIQLEFPGKLKMLGFIEDEELHHLYASASAYVTSSLYEGYGMPLAEASITGCPVICPDQEEMREATCNLATYYSLEDEKGLEEALQGNLNFVKEGQLEKQYLQTSELAEELFNVMISTINSNG